jgi:O-antigen/teichoic acid export membrane protein
MAMRIGQTSFVTFAAKVISAGAGFVATIYFARELGSSVLGVYFLILSIVGWVSLGGSLGLAGAIAKRISEGEDAAEYQTAGLLLLAAITVSIVLITVLFEGVIDRYLGVSQVGFIVLLLVVTISNSYVDALLQGLHKVHVYAMLRPVRRISRTVFQAAGVAVGFGLVSLVLGYALGGILVILLGIYVIGVDIATPARRHFESLVSYGKYAWLGKLESKTFHEADIVILGLFVASGSVGVYGVTWSLASFLILFSTALSTTLFPEISKLSAEAGEESVAGLLEDSLTYAGLITIPGLVGGFLLSERILAVYGQEFTRGATVLWVLILAVVFYGYQKQYVNTLGGIDRPQDAFQVNAILILANVALNPILIAGYGMIGAAVATLASTILGTAAGYWYTSARIEFDLPLKAIGQQVASAVCMAGYVIGVETIVSVPKQGLANIAYAGLLVGSAGFVYFLILTVLSAEFRRTLNANAPKRLKNLW